MAELYFRRHADSRMMAATPIAIAPPSVYLLAEPAPGFLTAISPFSPPASCRHLRQS